MPRGNGRTADEQAQWTAELWRDGLARWDQPAARINTFAGAVDRTIYTPGSRDGVPLTVLRSFAAPPAALLGDEGALRDRLQSAATGLLGLVGVDADPIRSREHILVSTLLDRAWRTGHGLDVPTLIQQIQKPPVERVGVLDIDSFFPSAERFELAMLLNNLLASPGFAVWRQGEPLDVAKLLYAPSGRPRLSIMSIAHLSDTERMFFVTMLLNEVVTWVRSQPGSGSLRAILYMDEIFGYFPPTANPPSKRPMLTLLKQARAHGLGVVLATQNPVDLDYKGLANAGTWFVGRLQTERDKARVIDGLTAAGSLVDQREIERLLGGLASRIFLLQNAHEDAPVLFQTRWALSYLSGPLTGPQISRLMADRRPVAAASKAPTAGAKTSRISPSAGATSQGQTDRPAVPGDVAEGFLSVADPPAAGERLVYRPALGASATLHYANARVKVDTWEEIWLLAPLWSHRSGSPWKAAVETAETSPILNPEPQPGASFGPLPAGASNAKSYTKWAKMLATHLYRARPLRLWRCRKPTLVSEPGDTEGDFKAKLRDALRESRDVAVEKLRRRFAPKLARLQERIAKAEQRVEVEREQYSEKRTQAAISIGATVVGALFGRKLGSLGNLGRATTAMRGTGRAAGQRGDIARARQQVERLREQLQDLERRFEDDRDELQASLDVDAVSIKTVKVTCRKTDLDIQPLMLVWVPFRIDADGLAEPASAVALE